MSPIRAILVALLCAGTLASAALAQRARADEDAKETWQVVTVGAMEKIPPSQAPAAWQPQAVSRSTERPTVTWVSGAVRDTTGEPVPGADVYAFAIFHGGMRMSEMIRAAKADQDGH